MTANYLSALEATWFIEK